MQKLYIPVGIPQIGKTTYFKVLAKDNPYLILIDSDEIRKELFKDDSDEDVRWINNVIHQEMSRRTEEALKNGFSVYYDSCNILVGERKALIQRYRSLVSEIIAVQFPNDLDRALYQNSLRKDKKDAIYIKRMADSLVLPSFDEGFDEIICVES